MNEETFTEKIQTAGDQLAGTVKSLLKEGNIHKITIRGSDGRELLAVPLTAGVAISGIAVLAAPTLAAIAAIGTLFSSVSIEVERTVNIDPDDASIIDAETDK